MAASSYNKIMFGKESRLTLNVPPVKLAKFTKVPGATVYSGLFQHFEAPDGEQCYFYHETNIPCEALDPGPYPLPEAPNCLEQILLYDLPHVIHHMVPDGPDQYPRIYVPPLPQCPAIAKHAVPTCALSGIFGGVSPESAPILCREEPERPPTPEPEPEEVEIIQWQLPESPIFKQRKEKEADSKDYFDNGKVKLRCLTIDWNRLLGEERFKRFVSKNDDDVRTGGDKVESELEEIKGAFQKHYGDILRMFDYYCAVSTATGKSAHAMQQNSYMKMVQDCDLVNPYLTIEDISGIFVVVNYEEDKKSVQSEVNEDKALMRCELVEALVRMAVKRYIPHEMQDVSDACDNLMNHIMSTVPPEARVDPDTFRTDRFYFEELEKLFQRHGKALKVVFEYYENQNAVAGRAKFGLDDAVNLMNDAKMLGEHVSMRDLRLCWFMSRMLVIDEVKSRHKFTSLSMIEFLEWLGRLADCANIPVDEDLESIGAESIMDFEVKLKKADPDTAARLRERRPSAGLMAENTRPLAPKLERFLFMLMGRLAIRYKGGLVNGSSRLNFKQFPPNTPYITIEQLQELSL